MNKNKKIIGENTPSSKTLSYYESPKKLAMKAAKKSEKYYKEKLSQ